MLMARPQCDTPPPPCLPGHSVQHEVEMEGAHYAKCYCIFVIKLHITSKHPGLSWKWLGGWVQVICPSPQTLTSCKTETSKQTQNKAHTSTNVYDFSP
jgi:hypothetical protein